MSEKATISPQTIPAAPGPAQLLSAQNDLRKGEANQKKPENSNLFVQPKLTVGAPDDPYEKEADAMADRVMRMPEQSFIQRKCAGCEKEESLQRKPVKDEEEVQLKMNSANSFIQRKCQSCEEEKINRKPLSEGITPFIQAKSASSTIVTSNAADTIQSSRGSGSTLDSATQNFMSSRFGADFTSVKIHTDSNAVQLSRGLNAKAFTVGSDIYFNQGTFSPNTSDGKQLLAHELTHTLQQGGSAVKKNAEREGDSKIDHRSDAGSFIQRKVQNQISSAPPESTILSKPEVHPKEISRQLPGLYNVISSTPPPDDPNSSAMSGKTGDIQRKDDSGSDSSFKNFPSRILNIIVPVNKSPASTLVQRQCATSESEEKVQRKAQPGSFANPALDSSAAPIKAEVAKVSSPPAGIIQRNRFEDAWDATGGRVVSAVGSAASTVYDAAGNVISGAIEWVEERAESIINRIAPGLIDFLRGDIIQNIKDALSRAVDAATGGLFSRLQAEGLQGVLEEFVSSIISTMSGAVENGCRAFAVLAQKILDFIRMLGGAALQRIVSFFRRVGGLLSSFWNNFALPIWDAVRSFAGSVWEWITTTAAWLWRLIQPIISGMARAWNWLMRQFGIAWRAAGSILDWLKGKAQQAWNWLMELIEPVKTPLMIIGGILLMLSPLGPIVAIGAGAYALYRGIQWVRENWNSEVFVRFRRYLKEHVLDVISSGIESLKNSVIGAFGWMTNTLLSLQAPLIRLLHGIGAIAVFRFIRAGIQSFANLITRAVNWAGARLAEVGRHIINVARDIWEFLRPYAIILAKLSILALNPWLLPPVIAAWAWRILPDCFKPPIINFVIGIMISVLRAMPDFKLFGESWPLAKQHIIEHLQVALDANETEKIRISNRIAQMVSELDLELIGNQIESVRQSPAYFDLELQSELLGINGTQVLPFERTSEVLPEASPGIKEESTDSEMIKLLSRSSFSASDVEAEEVGTLQLEPEIQQQLMASPNGEIIMDDQAGDRSRTIRSLLTDLTTGEEEANPAPVTQGAATTGDPDAVDQGPPSQPLSREEMTEQQLGEMISNSNESSATAPCEVSTQPDAGGQISDELKIGPLTERQRARYMRNQMWNSVKKWFRCNWHWVVPAVILAIIALIALEIVSGGTVTVAFEVIGAIMMGVAAVKAAVSIAQFGVNSMLGQIAAAARNFANAMAVLTIELVMALTFGLGDTIRSTQRGLQSAWRLASGTGRAVGRGFARGARTVGRAGRALVRGEVRQAGSILRTAARGYVRRGRVVMAGVGRRFGAGYKNLRQLTRALYERVRFRRFKLSHEGRIFQLWGEINPWVLLASGEIAELPEGEINSLTAQGRAIALDDDLVRTFQSLPVNDRNNIERVLRNPDFDLDLRSRAFREIGEAFHTGRVPRDDIRSVIGKINNDAARRPVAERVQGANQYLAEISHANRVGQSGVSRVRIGARREHQPFDLGDGIRTTIDPIDDADVLFARGSTIEVNEVKNTANALAEKLRARPRGVRPEDGNQLLRMRTWREGATSANPREVRVVIESGNSWTDIFSTIPGGRPVIEELHENAIPLVFAGHHLEPGQLRSFHQRVLALHTSLRRPGVSNGVIFNEMLARPEFSDLSTALRHFGII